MANMAAKSDKMPSTAIRIEVKFVLRCGRDTHIAVMGSLIDIVIL